MKNILLPTDFSDNSWNAIEYALNFYKDSICNFYVLHVNRLSNLATDNYLYDNAQNVLLDINVEQSKKQLKALLKKITIKFGVIKTINYTP